MIFKELDLLTEIYEDKLDGFLQTLWNNYQLVPYHNFTHAFSLTHFAFWLLKNIDTERFFTKDDILAIILGCLGHDLNHPGMNNAFLVKSKDNLALLYNDISVLENMHCSLLFQIMDIVSPEKYSYIRQVIIEGILWTDMTKHKSLVDKLKALHEKGQNDPEFKFEKSDRVFLAAMIVHACDLSNLLYKFDHYHKWGIRITQEFSDQYLAEEKLDPEIYGPPTAFLKYTGSEGHYKSQLGFMNFVITPMWKVLHEFLQFDKVIMDNLEENKKIVESLIK